MTQEISANDEQVLTHLERGELSAAATRALRLYGPKIQGFLWLILRDEEAVQETYAQFSENLWRGIGRFRGDSAFRTFCYQIAYNAARSHLKDPYRRRGRRLATREQSGLVGAERDPTEGWRRTTARRGLDLLRDQLDPEEQTLLALRVDQRMGWREIAHVIAEEGEPVSEVALRKRFERLKARLQEIARAEGLVAREEPE